MKRTVKLMAAAIAAYFMVCSLVNAWEDHRFELWVKNLKNENVLVRKNSAKALARLGDDRAVPFLLAALEDDEAEVRAEVCRALGSFPKEEIKKDLTRVLYKDKSPMVKNAAKKAIDRIDTYISAMKEKKLKEMKDAIKGTR